MRSSAAGGDATGVSVRLRRHARGFHKIRRSRGRRRKRRTCCVSLAERDRPVVRHRQRPPHRRSRTRTQLPSRVYLAGLHGMEIEVGARRWQHPDLGAAREHVRALERAARRCPRRVPGPDSRGQARVGRRPRPRCRPVSGAAASPTPTRARRRGSRTAAPPPTGNLVLEFLPNIACHKGDATPGLQTTSRRGAGRRRGSSSSETM